MSIVRVLSVKESVKMNEYGSTASVESAARHLLRVILTVLEKFMGLHHSPPEEELREEEDAGHQENKTRVERRSSQK